MPTTIPPPTNNQFVIDAIKTYRMPKTDKGKMTHISADGLMGGRFNIPKDAEGALFMAMGQGMAYGWKCFMLESVGEPDALIRATFDIDSSTLSDMELAKATQVVLRNQYPDAPSKSFSVKVLRPHVATLGKDSKVVFTPHDAESVGRHIQANIVDTVSNVHICAYALRKHFEEKVDVDLGIYHNGSLRMPLSCGRAKKECSLCSRKNLEGSEEPVFCPPNCLKANGFCFKDDGNGNPIVYYPSLFLDEDGQQDDGTLGNITLTLSNVVRYCCMHPHGTKATALIAPTVEVPKKMQLHKSEKEVAVCDFQHGGEIKGFLRSLHPSWSDLDIAFEKLKSKAEIRGRVQQKERHCAVCERIHSNRIVFYLNASGQVRQYCFGSNKSVTMKALPSSLKTIIFPSKIIRSTDPSASLSDIQMQEKHATIESRLLSSFGKAEKPQKKKFEGKRYTPYYNK